MRVLGMYGVGKLTNHDKWLKPQPSGVLLHCARFTALQSVGRWHVNGSDKTLLERRRRASRIWQVCPPLRRAQAACHHATYCLCIAPEIGLPGLPRTYVHMYMLLPVCCDDGIAFQNSPRRIGTASRFNYVTSRQPGSI